MGDAVNDRQAEADACVVTANARGAALERLGQCANELRGEQLVGGVRGESLLLGDVCLERSSRPSMPVAWIPEPGPDYARILGELISSHDLRGNLISDAALALENGVALISTDTDFARFRGLRWLNPLD